MASKINFKYITTGTGELSGPSFVKQTELAINELGSYVETVETTAGDALTTANSAQAAANTAQTTANSALSQSQTATALANQAQQAANAAQNTANNAQTAAQKAQTAANSAQDTADEALAAAQGAQGSADGKAPVMHASASTTYGSASDTLYGHVQLSDATDGTQTAATGGTAATPYAVAQVSAATATAQQTADAAQQTASAVQSSLSQYANTVANQLNSLTFFDATTTAIDAQSYAGNHAQLYLTSSASASTNLPSGITYPCYFWTETTQDGNTSMMFVLSGNTLYSQTGLNSTPDSDSPTWSFTGWQQITYTAATTSALGVVRPDGTTTEVAADGTLSINTNLLSQVYKFKGSVATVDDLPSSAAQGDVYNVTATDANYAWTGAAWDNIGGIEAVDSAPVRGSTNPVSSGGVYTALANQKSELEEQIEQATSGLTPDNVTIASSGGKLRVKDVAIGGDTSDLASARGIFNAINVGGVDCNTLIKQGVYSVNQTGTTNGPGFACKMFVSLPKNSVYITQLAFSITGPRLAIRGTMDGGDTWTDWTQYISVATIGDGITVNNGIISVPEYEGATASAAGTAGLVPPAAAGEQDKVLRGDGEWGEYLPLAGGTMMGGLFGTAVALSGSAIDVSTGSCFTKTITANTTFSFTGAPTGKVSCFSLILTNGGSRTVTWPSSVKWTEGTPPELASSGIDVITFLTADGGTTWYGVHSVQGAA